MPGGQRITLAVVPLASVRQEGASHASGSLATVLTPVELAVSGMHQVAERRVAHLAGRVAAKFALIHHLRRLGLQLGPQDIGLTQWMAGPQQGRPVVQLPAGVPACDVSITHSHELAVAVATTGGRVGVDLERVGARAPSFLEEAFTASERDWLAHCQLLHGRRPDELWTLGWCLKEALVKCSGQGLRAALQQVTFSGWTEQDAVPATLPLLTEEPGAFARLMTLHTHRPGPDALPGLLALGRGYALALLRTEALAA